jgi:hypothetical protein
MYGNGAEVVLGAGRELKGLVGEGQSIHSIRLVWRELILAQRAAVLSKGFFSLLLLPHIAHYSLYLL